MAAKTKSRSTKSTARGRSNRQFFPIAAALIFAAIGVAYLGISRAASSCGPAGAWSSSVMQNGQNIDGGYFFDNNVTHIVSDHPQSQTIWEASPRSWGICSLQPNPPIVVKTYAEEQKTVNKPIKSFTNMTNTVSYGVPARGEWEAADDLWVNGTSKNAGAIEVMIWTYNHYQRPAGTEVGAVTIGTQHYTFWRRTGSHPIYTFVYQTNTTSTTVHMLSVFNWLASHKYISTSMPFSQFNWGYEIVGTHGLKENFTTSSFALALTQ